MHILDSTTAETLRNEIIRYLDWRIANCAKDESAAKTQRDLFAYSIAGRELKEAREDISKAIMTTFKATSPRRARKKASHAA